MAGEFDLSDKPGHGYYERGRLIGIGVMTGIIWANDGTPNNVLERLLYDSIEDWAADIQDEYPQEEIVWALDEPAFPKRKAKR
jgi:hypothetical protein